MAEGEVKTGKRQKSLKWYERKLREAINERKGMVDLFLEPQIQMTAKSWQVFDDIARELSGVKRLSGIEMGSMGQMRAVTHPLLQQYYKASRELRANLQALGLNYDVTPKKVNEAGAAREVYPLDAFERDMRRDV